MPATGQSSAQLLGIPTTELTEKLAGHLIREIIVRGSSGGPLEPLAAQLNHDLTHLQGQQLERMLGQLTGEVRDALARLDTSMTPPLAPELAARTVYPKSQLGGSVRFDQAGHQSRYVSRRHQAGESPIAGIRAR
jgi:hypothetical protein